MENEIKDKKYQVTLTYNQLCILENALDVYLRIGIGQLEIVGEVIEKLLPTKIITSNKTRDILNFAKKEILGFNSGSSFGITNPDISDKTKIAYDMNKSIQKCIADTENHSKMSVWRNGDILHLGSESSIKITKG